MNENIFVFTLPYCDDELMGKVVWAYQNSGKHFFYSHIIFVHKEKWRDIMKPPVPNFKHSVVLCIAIILAVANSHLWKKIAWIEIGVNTIEVGIHSVM